MYGFLDAAEDMPFSSRLRLIPAIALCAGPLRTTTRLSESKIRTHRADTKSRPGPGKLVDTFGGRSLCPGERPVAQITAPIHALPGHEGTVESAHSNHPAGISNPESIPRHDDGGAPFEYFAVRRIRRQDLSGGGGEWCARPVAMCPPRKMRLPRRHSVPDVIRSD